MHYFSYRVDLNVDTRNSFILQNNVTEGMKLIEELFMLCFFVDKVTQELGNYHFIGEYAETDDTK